MPRWRRVTGVAGLAAGAVAAAAGGALAAEKLAVGRIRLRPDPAATEPFGRLRGRVIPVAAADGIPLHVEVDGPDDAPLTMIFCHGYALNQDSWHYQRRDLAGFPGYRLVFWDQRCHGRSGRCGAEAARIRQTGSDLLAIIQEVAPDGAPVVLAGHSMGGMTITALADQHPELFGTQVKAVAMISTAAGGLRDVTLGLPGPIGGLLARAVPGVMRGVAADGRAGMVERIRQAGGDLAFLGTRFIAFGDPGVSPAITDFLEQMIRATPIEVISQFLLELLEHDLRHAVPVLGKVPTVVISGGRDRLTPPHLVRAIADAASGAKLVTDPSAGHAIILEHPDIIIAELRELMNMAAESTAADEPAADEPASDEPAADEPAAEEPGKAATKGMGRRNARAPGRASAGERGTQRARASGTGSAAANGGDQRGTRRRAPGTTATGAA